jgi:hypothetical protein
MTQSFSCDGGLNNNDKWRLDPIKQALKIVSNMSSAEAGANVKKLPDALCGELGLRILMASVSMSSWMLRRVEKVAFERDRSVSKRIDIEFRVPHYAPVCVDSDGVEFWLVPLALMNRRTLVNLQIQDENARAISLPGMRLTQELDQSVLLAAAAAECAAKPSEGEMDVLRDFIRNFIAGEHEQVIVQRQTITLTRGERSDRNAAGPSAKEASWSRRRESAQPGICLPESLGDLVAKPLVSWAANRLERGFTLYLFLPVSMGRSRRIQMSFEEPTDWLYQVPKEASSNDGSPRERWTYEPMARPWWIRFPQILSRLGLRSTRIRFEVPAAESASSYHFEASAPHGVRIESATLIAGRPNEDQVRPSFDRVEGHYPTIGLHAVEIPNESLCQTQLELVIPARGWLTTMLVSCLVIVAVTSVVWQAATRGFVPDQVTNIVLVLVTTSAGAATLIAQSEFRGVAARLVAYLRALGAVAVTLPVVEAGVLVANWRTWESNSEAPAWAQRAMMLTVGLGVVIFLLTLAAWTRSRAAEWWRPVRSPWDMTVEKDVAMKPASQESAIRSFGFRAAAVGIRSAEAWRKEYWWSDALQREAVSSLYERLSGGGPGGDRSCLVRREARGVCPFHRRSTNAQLGALSNLS